jgi:predicted nucleotide-binding protein (sugar kinase/HSP70/actin superfamily)
LDHLIAIPPLGSWSCIGEAYVRSLGLGVVSPPETTRRTLDLGIQHCPETLCVPCKLLFGNYLEAVQRGANTIVMLGGPGTCRLGYSTERHRSLLADLGYHCSVHTLDLLNIQGDMIRLTRALTVGRPLHTLFEPLRLLMGLLRVVDQIETAALALRPRERVRGSVDGALSVAMERVAEVQSTEQLQAEEKDIVRTVESVAHDPERQVLRLGLVGDMYTILNPFLNLDLERELARREVEVRRWFPVRLRMPKPVLPVALRRDRQARALRAGDAYLARDVGGFARPSVAEAALMSRGEVDGLVHVAPFNCTPEIVAQSALVALQRDEGLPVLNLSFDEQTARAGMLTRIEAFVDMVWARKRRRSS